jgi:hypothetical protein
MPTILRKGGYRFFFFSNETQEPPHVHVQQAERYAKFWLRPIRLAKNVGFRRNEITQIGKIVSEKRSSLLKAWHGHFGK